MTKNNKKHKPVNNTNASAVDLPSNSVPSHAKYNAKSGSFLMLLTAVVLVCLAVPMHNKYEKHQRIWLAEAKPAIFVAPVKSAPARHVSEKSKELQQQISQMKTLMEKRRKLQSLEMEVLRYELGTNQASSSNPKLVSVPEKIKQVGVDEDISFARDVAKQAVQQEVEDFLDKVDLLSKIGGYVAKRISD